MPVFREKLSSLSEFAREIKVGSARYYNKRHHRRGYFWGDRFKSVIVKDGETAINCKENSYLTKKPFKKGRENDFPALAAFLITALMLIALNRENRNY